MRIGVDVDGVLTDIEKYMWDYGAKYSVELNRDICIDHSEYSTADMFGWGEEQDDIFWKGIYTDYCTNVPVERFASEVIKKLKKEGHEIYIITARGYERFITPKGKKKSDKILKKWLKKNKINYNKLIFTGKDKIGYCLENKIDIMIDDCPYNIRQISKKIPMICMHADYNTKVRGKNVVRCHSWYEVYNRINSLEIPNEE